MTTGVTTPPPLADDVEAVVVSTATPDDNPEVVAARGRGRAGAAPGGRARPVCAPRARTLAVAGTHGKTTTSAMLATILRRRRVATRLFVGAAMSTSSGRSAAWGGDGPLVVEADESDGTFLALGAERGVVTNVEPDHLEHWGGEAAAAAAFGASWPALPGAAVLCADDPGSPRRSAARRGRR